MSIGAKRMTSVGHWPMDAGVEFEWHDTENHAYFLVHGFDFAYAIRVFLDPQLEARQT